MKDAFPVESCMYPPSALFCVMTRALATPIAVAKERRVLNAAIVSKGMCWEKNVGIFCWENTDRREF